MLGMEVMKAIGFKSTFNTVKKLANFIFYVPKTLFQKWLQMQIRILCFPFYFVPAVFRLVWRKRSPQQQASSISAEPDRSSSNPSPTEPRPEQSAEPDRSNPSPTEPRLEPSAEPDSSNSNPSPAPTEPRPEPSSDEIVRQVKRLRNSVAMSICHFTGSDFFWDIPILNQKVKRFSEVYIEGDPVKIAAAKKALEEHPVLYPKPNSKEEYEKLMAEHVSDTVPKSGLGNFKSFKNVRNHNSVSKTRNCAESSAGFSNILKPKKKVEFKLDNEETLNETQSFECPHDMRLTLQNRRLRNQLTTTNHKLEEVLKSSNNLLEEVRKFTAQMGKCTDVLTKITNLDREVDEEKRVLHEMEDDRNELRQKLFVLEQLIKEEEDYLNNARNRESGNADDICDLSL